MKGTINTYTYKRQLQRTKSESRIINNEYYNTTEDVETYNNKKVILFVGLYLLIRLWKDALQKLSHGNPRLKKERKNVKNCKERPGNVCSQRSDVRNVISVAW